MTRRLSAALVLLATAAACGGAGGDTGGTGASPSPSVTVSRPPLRRAPERLQPSASGRVEAYSVTATSTPVVVHDSPGGRELHRLAHPQPSGAPLTFLLKARAGDWLEVYLPVRPNGSTGWVRAAGLLVRGVPWRLEVLRGAHRLRVYRDGRLVEELPVGIGKSSTPTPGGVFYLKELLVPPDPDGFYGPYAYGLSGFSNVLTSFAGGEGVIGLHGTNDPSSVGRDASAGCIRLRNADVSRLARLLPLGTPVHILA